LASTITLPAPIIGVDVEAYGEPPVSYAVAKEWEQRGYARGRQEAEAFAQAQIVETRDEYLQVQEALFQRIHEQFEQMVSTVATRVPNLVLAMVRRLWGGLELTPESVRQNLEDLLREISPDGEQLQVLLCPEDFALLQESDKGQFASLNGLVLVEDEGLEKGDCLIRSRFGTVDARIETKLKKVAEEMRGS